MNIAKFIIIVLLTLITASQIQSQTKTSDKGLFKENNDGFFGKILQGIEDFELTCPPKSDPNVILGSKGEKIWEGLNLQLNKS